MKDLKGYRALRACNQNNISRSERREPHYRELEKRRIKEEKFIFQDQKIEEIKRCSVM